MDIQRKTNPVKKKIRRLIYILIAVAVLAAITIGVSRLPKAVPGLDRGTLYTDTVKRGEMVRNVRGLGTLVPEDIHWIPAVTQGRVDKILAHPGDTVKADTVILELSDPAAEQALVEADSQLKASKASYNNLDVQLKRQHLDEEAAAAKAHSDYQLAKMQADSDADMAEKGLVPKTTAEKSRMIAEQMEKQNEIEQKKLDSLKESERAQLEGQQSEVDRLQAMYNLRKSQFDSLHVRAGSDGVLQVVPVDVGQQVQPGANLARVSDPGHLKAQIKIAETQIKDVAIGQPASIDTRNGIVEGKVTRIDPSSQNGTFTVDVSLIGQLPKGAKENLSVDGTIELEHLDNVINVGRPVHGEENSTISLFKIINGGTEAVRVQVKLGKSSVSSVEVLSGLQPGDQVILSDMSQYDNVDRIRIN